MCQTKVSRKSRNTSNMTTHLKSHHQKVYASLQCSPTPSTSTPKSSEADCSSQKKRKLTGPLDVAFSRMVPLQKNSVKWRKITDCVTDFLAKSMSPIRIVDLECFKKMIAACEPNYTVPSRKYFSETAIPTMYNTVVERVKRELVDSSGSVHPYSITSDAWTSAVNMNPYISLTCHFINDHWKLLSRNLGTIYAPEDHTGRFFVKILHLWSLSQSSTKL